MTLWRRPAGDFSALDSRLGRRSIRPEKLFAREARASVLFDPLGAAVDGAAGVRSFCFAGLSGSSSTSGVGSLAFSKNRDRLLEGDIAAKLLSLGSGAPRVKRLLSMDHFSVDGTLRSGASSRVWRVRPRPSTARALQGADCADGRGRRGDAGDCPSARVHDRHGVEMAGALREGPDCRFYRGRRSSRARRDCQGSCVRGRLRHHA